MDIMVSSNFERLLFDLYGRDGGAIRGLMEAFKSGEMTLSADAMAKLTAQFDSYRLDDQGVLDVIASVFDKTGYLLDPHTAIGVEAARKTRKDSAVPMVCLATAHPAKFPDAIEKAGDLGTPALPHHMRDLFEREESYHVLDNDMSAVQAFMREKLEG
jgi:threonine synthase